MCTGHCCRDEGTGSYRFVPLSWVLPVSPGFHKEDSKKLRRDFSAVLFFEEEPCTWGIWFCCRVESHGLWRDLRAQG